MCRDQCHSSNLVDEMSGCCLCMSMFYYRWEEEDVRRMGDGRWKLEGGRWKVEGRAGS